MFGPLFLFVYRIIALGARLAPGERGSALKAGWALHFSALSDGGLDEDFAEELFQLVRQTPGLLERVEHRVAGDGWIARRKRMVIASVRRGLDMGAETMFV